MGRGFLNPHSGHLDWRKWGHPKFGARKGYTATHLIRQDWATAVSSLSLFSHAENFSHAEILNFLKVFLSFKPLFCQNLLSINSYLSPPLLPPSPPTPAPLSSQLSFTIHVLACLSPFFWKAELSASFMFSLAPSTFSRPSHATLPAPLGHKLSEHRYVSNLYPQHPVPSLGLY